MRGLARHTAACRCRPSALSCRRQAPEPLTFGLEGVPLCAHTTRHRFPRLSRSSRTRSGTLTAAVSTPQPISGPGDEPGDALIDGKNRSVLGQQPRGIFLLDAEERTCSPHRLRHEIRGPQRHHPIHRGVLQQPPPALRARLPLAQRSPLWIPSASIGSVDGTINSAARNARSSSHVRRGGCQGVGSVLGKPSHHSDDSLITCAESRASNRQGEMAFHSRDRPSLDFSAGAARRRLRAPAGETPAALPPSG